MASAKTEHVLTTAAQVFLHLGYKRATMGDLAEAAGMSRPALYLVFESKEAVFKAVLDRHFEMALIEIRAGLGVHDDVEKTLMFALEIWCVRPFEMTLASPQAQGLLESGYSFAGEIVQGGFDQFEAIVAQALEPCAASSKLSARQIAHILVSAVIGFKQVASTADELRFMTSGLLTMVLAGIEKPGK